jgi:hypothetical protein
MGTIIHCWIAHSSQFPSPSISFSSKAWKGIKAGLCNNWGKFSATGLIHFTKQVVNKLTTNSASSLFFDGSPPSEILSQGLSKCLLVRK